eukprot:TRINITY_DN13427_c0_g3_i2.p1 TRINITY_DN13427_c0_g3~~TRINITY_DN13427_c0_g3_i2.p1  ORF type:complete len:219 (-),score=34.12 TRINITY_DN13427_c0_g3_i2:43-699(-)
MGNCSQSSSSELTATPILSVPDPGKITVYYWGPHPHKKINAYGRATAIYLTLDQAGVKYDCKHPNELPKDSCSMAVPVVDIDGVCIGQTPAILIALGEMYGLVGKTQGEKLQVLQALEDMNDVFGEHGKFKENEERKNKWFTYLEKKLDGKKWMGGTDEPTVADFHGVFAFEWIRKRSIDISAYPNTLKWWADIQAYPVVANMFASCVDGRTMLPAFA